MRWLLRATNRTTLRGDFASWQDALAASAGYETDLSIYGQLTEDIRSGKRDSSRLLSPLLAAFALSGDRARVLDFGGNLGQVYFDVGRIAQHALEWWSVVDLPEVVALGRARFEDQKLSFYLSTDAALARGKPNVAIFFHVLQYLASPFEVLEQVLELEPRLVVLHEFPIGSRERFLVQHLLPQLGGGSRPARIFDETSVRAAFNQYDLIEEIVLPAWDRTLQDARQVARIYRRRPDHQL